MGTARPLQRILLGTFYAAQSLSNYVLAWVSFNEAYPPPVAVSFGGFLVVASSVSLLVALGFFLKADFLFRFQVYVVASGLFILFYGWLTILSYDQVVRWYSNQIVLVLVGSVVVVVLNATAILASYKVRSANK